jgi:hypothetical protein
MADTKQENVIAPAPRDSRQILPIVASAPKEICDCNLCLSYSTSTPPLSPVPTTRSIPILPARQIIPIRVSPPRLSSPLRWGDGGSNFRIKKKTKNKGKKIGKSPYTCALYIPSRKYSVQDVLAVVYPLESGLP